VAHQLSSPYNSSSNGLAENAVKHIKLLLKKTKYNRENFDDALLHYNATKRSSGASSPGAIFYKRVVRTSVPGLADQPFNLEKAREERERDQLRMRKYAGGVKDRESFQPGNKIIFNEPHNGKNFS
jgi:hypothetical protein